MLISLLNEFKLEHMKWILCSRFTYKGLIQNGIAQLKFNLFQENKYRMNKITGQIMYRENMVSKSQQDIDNIY